MSLHVMLSIAFLMSSRHEMRLIIHLIINEGFKFAANLFYFIKEVEIISAFMLLFSTNHNL